jgi:hypothetical protein
MGPRAMGGRSRTLTDVDVDTLAQHVLAKASVLLKHLEKATLSLLLELMVSGSRACSSGKKNPALLIIKSLPSSHAHTSS